MNDHIQISDVTPRIQYAADGTQTQFSYPFPIFVEEDIEVYTGNTRENSGYTVLGAGDSYGGTVTFDAPPASGVVVTLRRSLSIERTADFQQSGAFRAKVINDELDYLTATLQQVADDVGRAVHVSSTDADANLELPSKNERANKILGFDASGDVIATSGSSNADGGVTDHAQLTGLSDDDHHHYHNDARGDDRYYTQGQVDAALSSKSDADHDHDADYSSIAHISDITNPHGVTAAQIGALPVGAKLDDLEAPDDNTDLDATISLHGLMSKVDKSKLDGIEAGATADQTDTEIETAYNNRIAVVSQAEAEAGVATTRRGWTAERVKQAIQALSVGAGGTWGGITGTLSSQTDIQTALDGKLSVMTPQQFGAVAELDDTATRANNVAAFEDMFAAWFAISGTKPLIAIIGSFCLSGSFSPGGQNSGSVRDMTGLHIYFDAVLRTKNDAATNYLPLLAWDGTAMSSHTFKANEPWDGHPRWRTVDTAGDWDKPTTSDSYRQQYVFFNTGGLKECVFSGRLRLQGGTIVDDLAAWGCARAVSGQGAMHCRFPDLLTITRFRAGFVTQPRSDVSGGSSGYRFPGWGAFCSFGHVYITNVDRGLLAGPNSLDGASFEELVLNDRAYSISHRSVWGASGFSMANADPDWAPAVTAAEDNGSGLIRITAPAHNLTTGQRAHVSGVIGTTEANGTWTVTKIDANNVDLKGSSFSNIYTSGGAIHRVLPGLQISEGSLNLAAGYTNISTAGDGKIGSSFHLTGGGKLFAPALKRDVNEGFIVGDVTVGTSINGELPPQGCDVWIGLDQIAQEHTSIPPGGIVQLEAGSTNDSNNVYIRGGIKIADMGVEPVTVLGSASTGDVVTLDFPDRKTTSRVVGGVLTTATAPITVSGALTTMEHSGKVLVTSGNVTVPNADSDVGFEAVIIAGGAHTVTFNSTTSPAMASGDVMTVAIQSTTVINAVLSEAADLVSFS